jgi:hypothetical protein
MKETRNLISRLFVSAIAFAMVSTLSAQTIGSAKVIRVKGPARYTTGNNIWQPLSVGTVLQPGSVVQTSTERGSYVDLVLGDEAGAVAQPVVYKPSIVSSMAASSRAYQPSADQNMVRVWENSALGIDKMTSMQTGADTVTETQLDLKAGRITGSVKKMSAASKYEVKLPNGVAGIRGTTYDISADGVVKVYVGSVVVAVVDPKTGNVVTQVVSGGQQYDTRSNQLTPLSAADMEAGTVFAGTVTYVPTSIPTTFASDRTIVTVSPVLGQ